MVTRKYIFKGSLISLSLVILSFSCFAQNARKMAKHLRVVKTSNFTPNASFTFSPMSKDPGGVLDALKNSFVFAGLKVISETSISNKDEYESKTTIDDSTVSSKRSAGKTNYVKSKYLVTISYSWIYSNYGVIQCIDIRGQVVDLNNDSEIVATFSYNGKFDVNPVAEAVALNLNKK